MIDAAETAEALIDPHECGLAVVTGWGELAQACCDRLYRKGYVIVYDPDAEDPQLVNLRMVRNAADTAEISASLKGYESILAQGVKFLEDPASKERMNGTSDLFRRNMREAIDAVYVCLHTTIAQMPITVRNVCANLHHYAQRRGVEDIGGAFPGVPAVLVAAGPSLDKNLHLLKQDGLRDRCIIIAVQTVLRRMLAEGIRPHFVTAIDYHELCRKYYEGLTADDVRGVQLVAEPKANPSVFDSFPGVIRCFPDPIADAIIGVGRPMMRSGSCVAHLSFYLAQHLGCDPLIFIGHDLGYTGGTYYGKDHPILRGWGPADNPWHNAERMAWEMKRSKMHTMTREGQDGSPIVVDEQMNAYLFQFETDWRECTERIIDATEGGVTKRGAEIMPLAEALALIPDSTHGGVPEPPAIEDGKATLHRVVKLRDDLARLRDASQQTRDLQTKMLERFDDREEVRRLLGQMQSPVDVVKEVREALMLVEMLNQSGAFNRLRADRAIALDNLDPIAEQRRRIERDLSNVGMIEAAADYLQRALRLAEYRLLGIDVPDSWYCGSSSETYKWSSE